MTDPGITPRYTVVVPVCNDHASVVRLLDRAPAELPPGFELLVVCERDDRTTRPAIEALPAGRIPPGFRLLACDRGPGTAFAIESGMRAARAPVVVVMMPDLSDDVSKVESMVRLVEEGALVASASRDIRSERHSGARRLEERLSRMTGQSLRLLGALPVVDPAGSFKAYSRAFLDTTPVESSHAAALAMELTVKAHVCGGRVEDVPVAGGENARRAMSASRLAGAGECLRWFVAALQHRFRRTFGAAEPLALVVSLLLSVGLFVPAISYPRADGEYWWPIALHEAFENGRQFGSEVVFTYGPWGVLNREGYYPPTLALMAVLRTLLVIVAVLCLRDLVRRRTGRRCTAALAVLLVPLIGAICWNDLFAVWPFLLLLCMFELHDRRISPAGIAVIVASAFVALGKFSALVSITAVMGAAGLDDLLRRRRPAATLLFVAAVGSLWLAAGQEPRGFVSYVGRALEFTRGYDEAMGTNSMAYQPPTFIPYIVATLLFAALFAWEARRRTERSWLYVALVWLLLFMLFKLGYIRADEGHIAPACAALLFVQAVHLLIVSTGTPRSDRRLATVAAHLVPLLITAWLVGRFVDGSVPAEIRAGITASASGLKRLVVWSDYERTLLENHAAALAELPGRGEITLPQGSSADSYPYPSAPVLSRDVSYSPRPVIMSYSAYTPALAQLNASRFEASAPESIVFHLETIDKRYPSLDDGASWPWLLTCYEISQHVDGALVLRRRGECARPRLELLGTVEGRLGETITLAPGDREPVFARVEIEPSARGRLIAALYKPPQLEIEVLLGDGTSKRRRLIRGSAASEFMLSPYVERADELACFFPGGDSSGIAHRVVRTLKISVRGGAADHYEPAYRLSLFALRGR